MIKNLSEDPSIVVTRFDKVELDWVIGLSPIVSRRTCDYRKNVLRGGLSEES